MGGIIFPDILSEPFYWKLLTLINRVIPRIHKAFDQIADERVATHGQKIFCAKGCSACCHHWVDSVEPFEMIYLDSKLRERDDYPTLQLAFNRRQIEFDKTSRQSADEHEDVHLYNYFLRDIPCPLLGKQGECSIHLHRVMSCRMFLSASPPEYCVRELTTDVRNQNFLIELPDSLEVLLSQISFKFRHLDIPEGLFAGLLRVQELFGGFGWTPSPNRDN